MPLKRSWWSDNWKSLVWLIFFMGVAWTQLDYKVDRVEAREIAIKEIIDRSYSRIDGEILKNNLSHIKKQLDRIEKLVQND